MLIKDDLFAVVNKFNIPVKRYTDHFDDDVFGRPKEKQHHPVYTLRCIGKKTRKNYLFIVPRDVYDRSQIYRKFTKVEISNYEYFLAEAIRRQ